MVKIKFVSIIDYGFWLLAFVGFLGILPYLYNQMNAENAKPFPFYMDYQDWAQELARAHGLQKQQEIQNAMVSYQYVLEADPQNPVHWAEWAVLLQYAATENRAQPKTQSLWLEESQEAFLKALAQMPRSAWLYERLAYVCETLQQHKESQKAMIFAQLLGRNRVDMVERYAQYWMNHWFQNQEPGQLAFVCDAFYLLNQMDFGKYGKFSLLFFKENAPGIQPCGNLFPKQDRYLLRAAKIFLDMRDMQMVIDLLQQVSESSILEKELFIQQLPESWRALIKR